MNQYRAEQVQPLTISNRFGDFYNLPPPTQGLASLLILAIYDRLYQPHFTEAEQVHYWIEATKQAFRVRDTYVADPRRMKKPAQEFLTEKQIQIYLNEIFFQS